jgi:hypothetical protein
LGKLADIWELKIPQQDFRIANPEERIGGLGQVIEVQIQKIKKVKIYPTPSTYLNSATSRGEVRK